MGFRDAHGNSEEKWTVQGAVSRLTIDAISMELFRRWHGALALGLEVLESSPELVASAMDVGLDGAQREVEGRRDLLVRSTFDVTKQNAGSVLGPQLTDCLLNGRAELFGLELIDGGLLRNSHFE